MSVLSTTGLVLRRVWRLLDLGRRVLLNLLLLALLLAAVALWWRSGAPPALQPRTTLVLDLSGRLVEQRSAPAGAREQLLGRAFGSLRREEPQTRLRDVLAALDAAARDPQIHQALLMLDDLGAAGLPQLREVAAAIEGFKAAGKPVFAWGSDYDQRQYYLAAHASELWMHPMGDLSLRGYGGHRAYYKDLLDRVGVSANVVRAGKFKNAAETFAANAPSPETLEADKSLYEALWKQWTGAVEKARKQPTGSVQQAIEALPGSLLAAAGDGARWAVQGRWVDALKTRDQLRSILIERGARADGDLPEFRQVNLAGYLARLKPEQGDTAVAVVVAEGSISAGSAGPGGIGGRSTGELIRRAREDKNIKALVLRVNSPGGSAFGSELVRRELELTREAGKPVVVSMGDLAASGGYWISLAADEVMADAATITGSIGVVAMLPSAQGALDKLGVHTGGVTTTWLGAGYDPRRAPDPRFVQLVQAGVDHIYRDFIGHASAQRRRTPEQIDAVAQGRVWLGEQALALGLVDRLGSYGDALKAAATRAKLQDGSYRIQYVEAAPGRLARWLQRLGVEQVFDVEGDLQGTLASLVGGAGLTPLPPSTWHPMAADLAWLAELAEPGRAGRAQAALVHCLCEAP